VKVVAVSQRVDVYADRNETRDALDQRLPTFLAAANLVTVAVPNGLVKSDTVGEKQAALEDWLAVVKPVGVVLSGGNDVGGRIDRDLTEHVLYRYAAQHNLPLLGICRGMQMMAAIAGAELKKIDGHVRTRHILAGEITGSVNSYHNLTLAKCPDGYRVMARSEEGAIEAIGHNDRPWQGWMWHPEREVPFERSDIERLDALFNG
jgi:gamma-glutamyl-gamma-aminobutyrate hydrolase PuuD